MYYGRELYDFDVWFIFPLDDMRIWIIYIMGKKTSSFKDGEFVFWAPFLFLRWFSRSPHGQKFLNINSIFIFSSSGRTGAVRVKWNRRRWYLVSGVFGLGFLSCWYNKSMLSENIWWGRYTGDSVGALKIGAGVVGPTRQLKLGY